MTEHPLLQSLDFSGQVAVIMGASRGIGLATAQILARYGAHAVLCARSATDIEESATGICEASGSASAFVCDVTDYANVISVVNSIEKDVGPINILVNCAGVIEPLATLSESDPELWSLAVDVNLKGTYHAMRAVLPGMKEQGGGTIVNISSGAANKRAVDWSHYCATKAGAAKLTAVAQKEVSEYGVRVVGLSPGTVATDMMRKIRDSKINVVSTLDWSTHIPPEWAGEGVAFLCGPEGGEFAGTDFSIKTPEGRARVGLDIHGAPDA